jgi:V/A-type H+-transporting ATPase subunit E
MSLDEVIKNVLKTGKAEAQMTVKEGQQEKNKQVKSAREEGQKLILEKTKESEDIIRRMNTQEMARAELDSKKTVLGSQKEVLDSVYERALSRLKDLPKNETLLRSLVAQNQEEIRTGRVYSNEKDATIVRAMVGTSYAGTIDCIGGFVIESQDGQRRIDLRYETRLKEIWDDSIKDISDLLWGEK